MGQSTVGIVKDLALWELGGKSSFAPAADVIRIETAAAVADGPALHIMEAYCDGAVKELAYRIGQSGLESCCCLHSDSFFLLKERHVGVNSDATAKGSKWGGDSRAIMRGCAMEGCGCRCVGAHALQDVFGLGMGATLDSPQQFDGVTSPAGREAMPQAASQIHPEGGWIVTTVKRTRADQPVTMALEVVAEAVGLQDLTDRPVF